MAACYFVSFGQTSQDLVFLLCCTLKGLILLCFVLQIGVVLNSVHNL
jgi:hypothetical protein